MRRIGESSRLQGGVAPRKRRRRAAGKHHAEDFDGVLKEKRQRPSLRAPKEGASSRRETKTETGQAEAQQRAGAKTASPPSGEEMTEVRGERLQGATRESRGQERVGWERPEVERGEGFSGSGSSAPPATSWSQSPAQVAATAPAPLDIQQVQQIAEQCLTAMRVHLSSGRPRVDLSLDLGTLGQARAQVTQSAGGSVKISFRLQESEGQQRLIDTLPDLARGLEERGIDLEQVQLSAEDGRRWSVTKDSGEAGVARALRQSGSGASDHRSGGDGRSRGTYVAADPEEDVD